jgi:hypothetical protein
MEKLTNIITNLFSKKPKINWIDKTSWTNIPVILATKFEEIEGMGDITHKGTFSLGDNGFTVYRRKDGAIGFNEEEFEAFAKRHTIDKSDFSGNIKL